MPPGYLPLEVFWAKKADPKVNLEHVEKASRFPPGGAGKCCLRETRLEYPAGIVTTARLRRIQIIRIENVRIHVMFCTDEEPQQVEYRVDQRLSS